MNYCLYRQLLQTVCHYNFETKKKTIPKKYAKMEEICYKKLIWNKYAKTVFLLKDGAQ